MKQTELQILFGLTCLACVNATNILSSDWPVLEFEKGETAYLPCPPQGHANAFFWRKGEWFNISESIASIVHGISDTTEKYDVLGDGTLVIMDMSFDDEGKYYCRIASERNECHGSITLYLKVSSEAIDIAIEGCTSSSSCVKVLEPSLEFQLTCTANMIAESMTLKWYNGSKEIIGVVDVSNNFGEKVKITNVIKFIFKDESHLTCEAEGVSTAIGSATIQLKKKEDFTPVENEAALTLLVPTIVLSIICLILTCILIYLIIRNRKQNKGQRKAKDGQNADMDQKGEQQDNDMEAQKAEETPFINQKEENAADLAKTEKESHTPTEENATDLAKTEKELNTLRGELKQKDDALLKIDEKFKELQTEMKEKKNALEERDRELLLAKQSLKQREIEQLQGTGKHKVKSNSNVENLQKDLREANHKISAAEEEKKNLQKEVEETRTKLTTAETTEKNLQKKLEDTRKKLVTAETAEKKELDDTRKKLATAETNEKNLQRELEDTTKKLATAAITAKGLQGKFEETEKKLETAETTKENIQEELKREKIKLSSYETTIQKLKAKLQEETSKRLECENTKQIILTNIIEMKDKILRNLPESIPTVIIVVKGLPPKRSYSHEDVLPKHKYRDVSLVSGPSCNGDIFDKMKDKVEACFSGRNTTIFLFGRFESGLHDTLHGENEEKGLIARVTHQTFLLSNQLKEDGFQVNINVTVASIEDKGNFWKFLSPSDPPEGKDKFTLANGFKIILNKYNVQSEQSFFKIASFMTPSISNPTNDGLLKITVETLVGPTTVSKGCFIIASISNLVKVPKILKGKPDDNFGELLFLLTRSSKSDLVLIPKVDPTLEGEPRKTFGAVKTALDDYR